MSTSDLWHVKLSEGCVVEMTLDEVDTAFNAGRIHAGTSVLAPGDFRWTTLGEAAGLEDDRETEPVPYSIAPVAADVTPAPPMIDFEAPTEVAPDAIVPRRRAGRTIARAIGVTALFAVLIAAGMVGGAYAAGPSELASRVTMLRERLGHAPPRAAAAVAAPPPAQAAPPAPVTAAAPEPAPAPPPQASVTTTAPATATVGVDALPDAKAAAKAKKKSAAPKTKRK